MEAALSFGSNLGDRVAHLAEGRRRVLDLPGVRELARAPLYETDPVDVRPEFQHLKFVNSVLVVDAPFTGPEWIGHLQAIEIAMGRVRGGDRNAPRPLDIDLLYLGDLVLDSKLVTVPHPRWATRRFVLQPLADVRPQRILPGDHRTVAQHLAALPAGEFLIRLSADWD
jgi:2-amino-4-hydroxy-6-hydroxymethyldihydropteridine diphosphokinase